MAVASMTVTYAAGAEAEKKDAELSFAETAFTLYADKVADFKAPALVNPNNLAVTYASSDENVAEVAADGTVTLTGDAGTAKITASFAGNAEYREGAASYTITVKETPKAVATVAATKELATKTEFVANYALTVAFKNYNNVFACDEAGDFIQLYGSNTLNIGDVIAAGWSGTYELYNGVTPEVTNFTLAGTTAGTFTPKAVAPADITNELVNSVVVIENVVFAEATTSAKGNIYGTVGDNEIKFYNNYTKPSVEAGKYNVTVVVTLSKVDGATEYTPSLYPIAYELVEAGETPEPVEPEIKKVTSIQEAKTIGSGKMIIDFPVTVGFINYSNIFVCDEAGDFIQIYKSNTGLKSGDVVPAGWEAEYSIYSNAPQLKPSANLPEATEGTFTPKTVAATDITNDLVNSVIVVENVVLDAATPSAKENFTGKVGETELSFRNNYNKESVEPGKYNITVVVQIFQNAPSLYVVNYEKVATDGISEIEAEDAEAVYYNLQGVEVANPANGVYIVRRGAKVTKEFIR